MQTLTILDLDGTLIPSHEIDNSCYWQAVSDVFHRVVNTQNLSGFHHVTDKGILIQWCEEHLGRIPGLEEINEVRERFLALTQRATLEQPELFTPLDGVQEWLEQADLRTVAIATGGWQATAECKLHASGLHRFGLPLFTADHATARTEIMSLALDSLRIANPKPSAQSAVTYVGDGVWDWKASQQLGWSFIGIARGARANSLRDAGAKYVYPDFTGLLQHSCL